MNETAIAWTDYTWNPASGCEKVSPGCKFCYAETIAEKFRGKAFPNGFELTLRPHKLGEPLKYKEPSRIFVNSMSDLFWEPIGDDYRDRVLEVIEATPQHQYQVLTKRPEELLRYSLRRELPPNFWAGVTVESTHTMSRTDLLRAVKAEIRFLSIEPQLDDLGPSLDLSRIHWVIAGGESGLHLRDAALRSRRGMAEPGTGADDGRGWRPIEERIDWARHIRDKCIEGEVAFFFKQWGGLNPKSGGRILDGRTWDEFPRTAAVARIEEYA